MTMRERMTGAVVLALFGVGAWFTWQVFSAGGPIASPGGTILVAIGGIIVLTSLFAGLAAATAGPGRRVDERDERIAVWSQAVRGYFYLAIAFTVLIAAMLTGQRTLANLTFAAILVSEIVSGLVMLALYRRAA